MRSNISLRDAAKRVAVVLMVALFATLLTPAIPAGAAEADSAKAAGSNGLWTYTTTEEGQLFGSADVDGNYGTGIDMANGKKIIFVDYITKKDFDLTDGSNYYSYRYSSLNGVVTISSRVNGTTVNKSGYFNTYGEVVVENYGWIEEIHYFDRGLWYMERYNYNGQLTSRVTKILSDAGNGRGIVTTTTDSETAPTTPSSSPAPYWPTTQPTATPYNPYWYPTPTPRTTVPPFTPPTVPPVITPTPTPTVPPTVAPTPTPPSQEVVPPVAPEPVSNLSSLKRSTKIEKKAYSKLSELNALAASNGWSEKRRYTRLSSSKKAVKTRVYLMGDFGGDSYVTFKFTHVVKKSGKKYIHIYYWKGKKVSASGVRKVIQRKIK